jgi:hypothetical protein
VITTVFACRRTTHSAVDAGDDEVTVEILRDQRCGIVAYLLATDGVDAGKGGDQKAVGKRAGILLQVQVITNRAVHKMASRQSLWRLPQKARQVEQDVPRCAAQPGGGRDPGQGFAHRV